MNTTPIIEPLKAGDLVYHSTGFMGHHYYLVVHRDKHEVSLRTCNEKGSVLPMMKQIALRDSKLVGSTVWMKVANKAAV